MGMYQEITDMYQKMGNHEEGDLGDLAMAEAQGMGLVGAREVRFWRWNWGGR